MGLIVGVTLVAAGVILFVMMPVLRGDWATLESPEDEITEVDARKQAALRGLRDAEYDFRSGKIDQEDYQALKSDLARQALEAMEEEQGAADHALDEATPTETAAKRSKGPAAKRAKGASPKSDGDGLEAEIARVRRGMAEGRTCPGCGHLNVEDSRFCTGCGERLVEVATTAGNPVSA